MNRKTALALALAGACAAPLILAFTPTAAVAAQDASQSQPAGVLSLNAQSSMDVPQDTVHITLFYEQEAKDPATLTTALNQHADAALQKAKGVTGVTAHTGSFSIGPSNNRDGRISAWRGRTEVVLESHDFAAASKLAGQMAPGMQVGDVQFSLSPEAQRAAEQKLTGQAIATFRQQASSAAQAFGYGSYSIREVNVGRNGGISPRPMMMSVRAMSSDNAQSAPVPIEGGTTTVTVSVSGSVQMK
ncbi:SIMPL domain-containing protein [Paraburkholderia hayleyella]|uniref:SIMPL domain-containing protein n=1 Tax=Paraburkholderia hayleyella TaxID=2152889 RepID=UPI0012927091|nr:SIMPL domain-containing protein [Paraburkholderia hayleyella]